MRPRPKTTHVATELLAVTASLSPLWPGQTWSNLSFESEALTGLGHMPGPAPTINSFWLPDGQP